MIPSFAIYQRGAYFCKKILGHRIQTKHRSNDPIKGVGDGVLNKTHIPGLHKPSQAQSYSKYIVDFLKMRAPPLISLLPCVGLVFEVVASFCGTILVIRLSSL